jgi:hypothetical protein
MRIDNRTQQRLAVLRNFFCPSQVWFILFSCQTTLVDIAKDLPFQKSFDE